MNCRVSAIGLLLSQKIVSQLWLSELYDEELHLSGAGQAAGVTQSVVQKGLVCGRDLCPKTAEQSQE